VKRIFVEQPFFLKLFFVLPVWAEFKWRSRCIRALRLRWV
jgi:hypothetical protein